MKHHPDASPRISIITPSYNQAGFLVQAIESVLDQGYPNLEYMIMDGGSTDGSIEIIQRYEKHLAFWESAPDNGQSHAVNKGFRRATGELVAWMNSDDYYLPGAFEAVAEKHRELSADGKLPGFFFGTGIRVDREGGLIGNFWPHKPVFDVAALVYGFDYILQPTVFIRRDPLFSVGLLDEGLKYCMDYDLWIRLAKAYPAAPVDHPVAASREYRETKSLSGGMERCAEIARVIAGHTGLPATPGVLYYIIITLQGLTREDRATGLFSKDFQRALEFLHTENLIPLSLFSDSDYGFPERTAGADPLAEMAAVAAERKGYLTGLEEKLEALHRVIHTRDEEITGLIAQLKESEADRDARLAQVESIGKQLAESEADRDARRIQIEELGALLAESEADRAARFEVIQDQARQIEALGRRYDHLATRMPVRVLRKLGMISPQPADTPEA
ncbi:glycosyltransferase [Desulfococcus sp.]|uniref:glycosyltransferase family 2 protein n=1 Tax=Desulfococcus sp. TaxID=2025834 RepID=UPI0035940428